MYIKRLCVIKFAKDIKLRQRFYDIKHIEV